MFWGDQPEAAQKQFEAWLCQQPPGENPIEVLMKKITVAQFVDSLLTESGEAPLDWHKVYDQSRKQAESMPADDFEPGDWVDVEACVRPGRLSANVEALQRDLPEEIRSGLNWSVDKRFNFVVSVFTPPVESEVLPDVEKQPSVEQLDESTEGADGTEIRELILTYPEGADKEAAALIQARNSVVAAWVWRKYAADTRLAANRIRIDPFCGVMGLKKEQAST